MSKSLRRPIKICFVCPKAYPLFNREVDSVFGGAEVDLYMLSTELAKDDNFEISCIVADYGQADSEIREGVNIIKSLNFDKNALSGAARIWRALRQANADIYVLKTASPGVPLAAVFCGLYKKVLAYRTASSRRSSTAFAAATAASWASASSVTPIPSRSRSRRSSAPSPS